MRDAEHQAVKGHSLSRSLFYKAKNPCLLTAGIPVCIAEYRGGQEGHHKGATVLMIDSRSQISKKKWFIKFWNVRQISLLYIQNSWRCPAVHHSALYFRRKCICHITWKRAVDGSISTYTNGLILLNILLHHLKIMMSTQERLFTARRSLFCSALRKSRAAKPDEENFCKWYTRYRKGSARLRSGQLYWKRFYWSLLLITRGSWMRPMKECFGSSFSSSFGTTRIIFLLIRRIFNFIFASLALTSRSPAHIFLDWQWWIGCTADVIPSCNPLSLFVRAYNEDFVFTYFPSTIS